MKKRTVWYHSNSKLFETPQNENNNSIQSLLIHRVNSTNGLNNIHSTLYQVILYQRGAVGDVEAIMRRGC